MENLKDNQMIVTDAEGNEHLMEILFTYVSPRNEKEFVFFYEVNNEEEVIVMEIKDDQTLADVEDEEDLKEAEEVFEAFQNKEE